MQFLVIDDHPLMLMALHQTIANAFPDAGTYSATGFAEAQAILAAHRIDIVLLDLYLSDDQVRDPYYFLTELLALQPGIKIAVISGANVADCAAMALEKGARGFIPKNQDSQLLVSALHVIASGGLYIPPGMGYLAHEPLASAAPRPARLTARQLDILELIMVGQPNKEISRQLNVSLQTVKAHVTSIMGALQVVNRTQVVLHVTQLDRRFPGWREPQSMR